MSSLPVLFSFIPSGISGKEDYRMSNVFLATAPPVSFPPLVSTSRLGRDSLPPSSTVFDRLNYADFYHFATKVIWSSPNPSNDRTQAMIDLPKYVAQSHVLEFSGKHPRVGGIPNPPLPGCSSPGGFGDKPTSSGIQNQSCHDIRNTDREGGEHF